MCMFCAAIPATLAIGASAQAHQQREKRQAEAQGKTPARPVIPAGPATGVVVAGLVTASILYHITQPG